MAERVFISFAPSDVGNDALDVPMPKPARGIVPPVTLVSTKSNKKRNKIKDRLSQYEKAYPFMLYPRNENALNACKRMTKSRIGATNLIITTNSFSR